MAEGRMLALSTGLGSEVSLTPDRHWDSPEGLDVELLSSTWALAAVALLPLSISTDLPLCSRELQDLSAEQNSRVWQACAP